MANDGYDRLVFEELDGERRRITLQGTEAPQGGPRRDPAFALGGPVRRSEHFEPGVQAPVVHITGTKERDLVVRVHFRDSLTGLPGNAREQVDKIESIRLAARPLRIVWGHMVRRGILAEFEPAPESGGEIPATLTFAVYDQGHNARNSRGPGKLSVGAGLDVLGSAMDDLNAQLAKLSVPKAGVPGLSIDIASGLQSLFGAIANPFSSLLALGGDIEAGIGETTATLGQIANQARTLLGRTQALFGFLSSVADPLDDGAALAEWKRRQAECLVSLQAVLTAAFELGVAAERRGQGVTASRIVTARAGDTVESLARRNGTTPAAILALNPTLAPGAVPPGTRVRLP
jgi:hypothetical protein